jgi:nicotinamide-nucleotide amidase
MKAEIICIGTELLLGHIINTNNSFIAKKLAEVGVDHYFQTTVGDNPQRLADTIRTGLDRSDVVITTGGLGPTVDDITTGVIARVIKKRLVMDKGVLKDVADHFRKQDRKVPKSSLRQALIPEGAKWLKNPFGTAPGLIIEYDGKVIIALPGPPREMEPMVERYVIPYLKKGIQGPGARGQGGSIIKSRSVKLIGLAEAAVDQKVRDLLNLSGVVTVGIYAKQGEVELRIMAKARNERIADLEIKKIERVIRKRFDAYIYGVDGQTLEKAVMEALIKRKKTIAVAESCTGGLVSHLLTNISGSSSSFAEGVVSYSNESKVKDLDVKAETIKKYGSVSWQVAKEMAKGIRKKAAVDIGLGVTGIAGPTGGTKAKPVGLVYMAISTDKKIIFRRFNFLGNRMEIRRQAAQAALELVRKCLLVHKCKSA